MQRPGDRNQLGEPRSQRQPGAPAQPAYGRRIDCGESRDREQMIAQTVRGRGVRDPESTDYETHRR